MSICNVEDLFIFWFAYFWISLLCQGLCLHPSIRSLSLSEFTFISKYKMNYVIIPLSTLLLIASPLLSGGETLCWAPLMKCVTHWHYCKLYFCHNHNAAVYRMFLHSVPRLTILLIPEIRLYKLKHAICFTTVYCCHLLFLTLIHCATSPPQTNRHFSAECE